jgi:hypothetical protein
VVGPDTAELAPGALLIAKLVPCNLGDAKARFSEALPLVAAADARVLAFGEHPLEQRNGRSCTAEAELEPGSGAQRVVPVSAERVGEAASQIEVGHQRCRAVSCTLQPARALEAEALLELAAAQRSLQALGFDGGRGRAVALFDAVEHASGGARRKAGVREAKERRPQ